MRKTARHLSDWKRLNCCPQSTSVFICAGGWQGNKSNTGSHSVKLLNPTKEYSEFGLASYISLFLQVGQMFFLTSHLQIFPGYPDFTKAMLARGWFQNEDKDSWCTSSLRPFFLVLGTCACRQEWVFTEGLALLRLEMGPSSCHRSWQPLDWAGFVWNRQPGLLQQWCATTAATAGGESLPW